MSNRRSVASCIVCSCQLLLIVVSTAYGFTAASRHVTIQGAAHPIIRSQKSRIQGWWGGQDNSDAPTTPSLEQQSEEEISALEREVLYSTQAELDRRSVNRAVTNALLDPSAKAETTAVQGSKWSIALAGGLSMGSIVFVLVGGAGFSGTQSILVGILASLGIGFVASRNPLEEEDSAGAVARTVRPFFRDCANMYTKSKGRANKDIPTKSLSVLFLLFFHLVFFFRLEDTR